MLPCTAELKVEGHHLPFAKMMYLNSQSDMSESTNLRGSSVMLPGSTKTSTIGLRVGVRWGKVGYLNSQFDRSTTPSLREGGVSQLSVRSDWFSTREHQNYRHTQDNAGMETDLSSSSFAACKHSHRAALSRVSSLMLPSCQTGTLHQIRRLIGLRAPYTQLIIVKPLVA
eukprot:gene20367-biopygen6682